MRHQAITHDGEIWDVFCEVIHMQYCDVVDHVTAGLTCIITTSCQLELNIIQHQCCHHSKPIVAWWHHRTRLTVNSRTAVSSTNKLQWNLDQNAKHFIQGNAVESFVCKAMVIYMRLQRVKHRDIVYKCNQSNWIQILQTELWLLYLTSGSYRNSFPVEPIGFRCEK